MQTFRISTSYLYLLDEFRRHNHHFQSALTQISQDDTTDARHLALLGEDLEEFANLGGEIGSNEMKQHSAIFPDRAEWEMLRTNVHRMILDLRTIYNHRVEQSHHGRPTVISWERTGSAGRPRAIIDPTFL